MKYPHRPRKRFGQNFLCDRGIIRQIIACINPKKGEHIVEIGPGRGALTESIISIVEDMDVVELDRDLIPLLKVKLFRYPKLIIHEADAMKFDFSSLRRDKQSIRIVGNLPYNISTPLIFYLLKQSSMIKDMYFMLQKEVADRLSACPGNRLYSRLSVMALYYCTVESLFTVEPRAFIPVPKVKSAFVRMTPRHNITHRIVDTKTFEKVIRIGFQQRRKTISNNYKNILNNKDFKMLEIDPTLRPERLDIEQYVRIANLVDAKKN